MSALKQEIKLWVFVFRLKAEMLIQQNLKKE